MRWIQILSIALLSLLVAGFTGVEPEQSPPPIPADPGTLFVSCMQDRGWELARDGDGYAVEVSNIQLDSYYSDREACQGQLPAEAPLTHEQHQRLYQLLLEVATCIAQHGFETHPPGFQAYLDSDLAWNPYAELSFDAGMPGSELEALEEACPQPTDADIRGRQ